MTECTPGTHLWQAFPNSDESGSWTEYECQNEGCDVVTETPEAYASDLQLLNDHKCFDLE